MDKKDIAGKLREQHQKFAAYLGELTEADFNFAPADKWTPGQQLDHVLRSVSAVATALRLPKFVPALLFGKNKRETLEYTHLITRYQAELAAGGRASGRFIPSRVSFERRQKLLGDLNRTLDRLCRRIERFSEAELDEITLPHPILGKLTVREMLYFTIYHVEHHQGAVQANLAQNRSVAGAES